MLDKKLKDSEKKVLFEELFGFKYEDISEEKNRCDYILLNEEYEEFWEEDSIHNFDFNTLRDFFKYVQHIAKIEGANELRDKINNALVYVNP